MHYGWSIDKGDGEMKTLQEAMQRITELETYRAEGINYLENFCLGEEFTDFELNYVSAVLRGEEPLE
jgi:hypothetical protein